MRKIILSIFITAVISLSMILLMYHPLLIPSNNSTETISNNRFIELKTYSGWKGVESMAIPLNEYIKSTSGPSIYSSDLLWPLANVENPFHDLLNKGTGVVIVTILSVDRVYRYNIYAYVVYKARIDKVIVEPQNTIELPSKTACVKDPALCNLTKRQHEVIKNLISTIKENSTIELIVPAFIAKESVNKANLTINDVSTPFWLLEPGYQYLLFLDPRLDGIHVHYDYVWGPWAYLVLDGRVYSLNHVKPPNNVSLDPSKLFKSPYIHWKPYPYEQLREIAIHKLSVNGVRLENFILKIVRG